MIVHSKIQKWGNGLALRVSGLIRDIPHLLEGTEVEVEVFEEGFLVRKSKSQNRRIFPYSEAELLEDINSELVHADLLAKPLSKEYE